MSRPSARHRGSGGRVRERLSLGQVTRVPPEHPLELLLGEPTSELALRALLGALEERTPELAVQLPAARRVFDRLARPVVHAPILAFRSAAVARLEASHP
jgi:hypothetical protein